MTNDEIDRLVAVKVMGWVVLDTGRGGLHFRTDEEVYWQPTADIAQAWQVVEKMEELGWLFAIQKGVEWDAGFTRRERPYTSHYHITVTVPLAICLAALKAVGVEVEP